MTSPATASVTRSSLFPDRPQLQALLTELHTISLEQEGRLNSASHKSTAFPKSITDAAERARFQDQLVALDEDKASAIYLMLRAACARRVFEAGTSYGVSTLYLLAAVQDNLAQARTSSASPPFPPRVWGTEHEPSKARQALVHVRHAFAAQGEADVILSNDENIRLFQMLEGDILDKIGEEKLPRDSLDALLLDIWAPLALPTLLALEDALRPGAMLFVDNSISGHDRYADLLQYLGDPVHGWQSMALPFSHGLEVAVKRADAARV
ncbi:hypothetical protein V8E36_008705 [Tilletia maclaganii]